MWCRRVARRMRALIVGATSAIAQETARVWAARGDDLLLVARDQEKLARVAADLRTRGSGRGRVETMLLDATDLDRHAPLVEQAWATWGGLDVVLLAHGTLPEQAAAERDWNLAHHHLVTNFVSVASLLTHLAPRFEAQRSGVIAVISSVAGDRGRASNYVYGAAKAGTTAWASGLRGRLRHANVHVLTIKPGFVATPMTAHLRRNALFADARTVGRGIALAIDRRKDVVYLPGAWRPAMALVRALPERIFKRLRV